MKSTLGHLILLMIMLCVSALVFADHHGMTLEDISKLQSVRAAELSPDGELIAFTRSRPREPYEDEDGAAWTELYLMSRGGEPRPFVTGEVSVSGLAWSADSRTLFYTAKRNKDENKAIYRIPVDGGESRHLASFDTDIGAFEVNSDESMVAFLAKEKKPDHVEKLGKKGFKAKVYEEDIQFTRLWTLDLTDDEAEPVMLPIEGHVNSMDLNPAGDLLLLQVSPSSLIDDVYMLLSLQVVDLEGNTTASWETSGKMGKAIWTDGGNGVAFIGANDLNDPRAGAVFSGDLSGELTKLVENNDSHIIDLEWADGRLYLLEHQGLESRVTSQVIGKSSSSTLVDYGNGIQTSISVSNGGQLLAITDTANHPREIYTLDRRRYVRQTVSNDWLADRAMGRQEAFEYKAADGLDLQGVLVYPVDYVEGQRYPMIAFIHGGPEAHRSNGWNTGYSQTVQVAAAQGYVSFIPNYRGSTGRGVEFSKLDQHAYADPEFSDIVDGKLALVENGLVDTDRVGITGGSYGGYATAWSATKLSEHYAAGVMFVGISNQLSKFGTTDIPNEMFLVHSRAWPWDDYQWMLETSPIYHVKKAKTPLLIMHGDSDTRVHPSQSMELYRYLKVLGQAPVRLVLYPGEGHGNRKAAAQLDYSMRLMRWMDHYLKGEGGEPPEYDLKHNEALEALEKSDEETEESADEETTDD